MKKKISIIVLSLLVICCVFTINALAANWRAPITAKGQGLQPSSVFIGVDANNPDEWPPGPLPPNYSAVLTIEGLGGAKYGEVLKPSDASLVVLLLVEVGIPPYDYDPNFTFGDDPNAATVSDASEPDFFPMLSWDPNIMGNVELRLGDANGPVLVDMKTTNNYQTLEQDANYYDSIDSQARMRYAVVSGESTQIVPLNAGWNWVSFNVLPADTSLDGFFGEHASSVEQVKTQTSSATNHETLGWIGNMNLMSNIDTGAMFKIKAKTSFDLSVTGTPSAPDMPIALQLNWNWIAYLPGSCFSTEMAVATILDDLYQIKSQTQSKTKISGTLMGTLVDMCPGKGYVLKMDNPSTLIYPTNP